MRWAILVGGLLRRGWQSRMNAVLRGFVERAQHLSDRKPPEVGPERG